MTQDDDPKKNGGDDPHGGDEDEFEKLAFLPPHTRMHYDDPNLRLENALTYVNPDRAVDFLRRLHGVHAGQEALLRALSSERLMHRPRARYWLEVYERIVG
ncbi:hypothetical protein QMT40_003490 [Parvibaculaceae bacterium PLY_AMNH_Bact1]|nr:hypothetical protein QMT40_003490 [Parvibaculaceae bacterium PLY_AMNH_Bact1]